MESFSKYNNKKQNTFIANILDPMEGVSLTEELLGVGDKQEKELWYKQEIVPKNEEEYRYYASKLDKETNELYFVMVYRGGKREVYCCNKEIFEITYNRMLNC